MRYTAAGHLCACGCKTEVMTPFSPIDWSLTFDGQSATLNRSIGNSTFACESHYFIRNNKVQWSYKIDGNEGKKVHRAQLAEKERFLAPRGTPGSTYDQRDPRAIKFIDKIKSWFAGR